MAQGQLNGNALTHARITIPQRGAWWADASLQTPVELTAGAAVTLKLADLELSGRVVSGGVTHGAAHYTLSAGAASWGRSVAAKSYANDAGVKLSTVLTDAATACGESIDLSAVASSQRLGPHYVRRAGPASAVLPAAWYVDNSGVTQLGARTGAAFTGAATITDTRQDLGIVTLEAPEIAALLPGAIVGGVTAVDVEHELTPERLVTRIWGAGLGGGSRRTAAYAALLDALLPSLRYRGVYEYRVVTQDSERLNLQPVLSSLGMPDLARVPVRPGLPGCRGDVTLGSLVLVSFVNADPGRPVVTGFGAPDFPGFEAERIDLAGDDDTAPIADPTGRVVRYGDKVSIAVAGGVAAGTVSIDPTATSASRVRA